MARLPKFSCFDNFQPNSFSKNQNHRFEWLTWKWPRKSRVISGDALSALRLSAQRSRQSYNCSRPINTPCRSLFRTLTNAYSTQAKTSPCSLLLQSSRSTRDRKSNEKLGRSTRKWKSQRTNSIHTHTHICIIYYGLWTVPLRHELLNIYLVRIYR
jgi:hypothetical protein